MNQALLTRVGMAPGVPGFETAVQAIATEQLQACCDEVRKDYIGNVIGLRKAKGVAKDKRVPRLMLAAHCDEVGMMVKYILGNGFIHFIQMGGLGPHVAQSQRVIIHGYQQTVRGVVVPKGNDENIKLGDLVIDTGLSREDLMQRVRPGDVITFENDVSILNDKMWVGRNFDNRIGTYCLLEAMRTVGETHVDVYACSTVQEEVGLRGARPAAFACEPDIGIAIDGSMTRQAYSAEQDHLCDPGKGTGIYVIDKLTIGHPALVQYLCNLCETHKIPYQRNIGGGTDAAAIQQSRGSVITTTIGAPVRYMHSTVQLCHADDIDATVALLVKFMESAHTFLDAL